MKSGAKTEGPSLAERLRPVRVGLREDLDVTRHLFRGRPAYVIRDPITFNTYQLGPADYQIFITIEASRPLGEVFDELVDRGALGRDDENRFAEFILLLHRLSFLNLPISDERLLYQRYQAKQRVRRKEKLMGFLSLRIPVFNPDAILERTIARVRFIFSRWFFAFWLLWVGAAAVLAIQNWDRLVQPLEGILATRNLFLMWFVLIVLKIFHEWGHAYACKHFGGYVPEMGIFLLVFTPCAYVDATSSWAFTRKRDRLIVCLAGMYVEWFLAAGAVFVWAMTGPSVINALAYNVFFLAGTITALFNINPLMRFDGYYVLSDLLEVPNLRQRATSYVTALIKRLFLSVPLPGLGGDRRLPFVLASYGLAATVYRIILLVAIAAIVASKIFLVGLGLAVVYVGMTLTGMIRRLTRYLWHSPETDAVRGRAVALSAAILVGIPLALLLIPVWPSVRAPALVEAEHQTVLRARTPGFVEQTWVEPGHHVRRGDLLVELRNDEYESRMRQAGAAVEASEIRRDAFRATDPARTRQETEHLQLFRKDYARRADQLAKLHVRAEAAGRVVKCLGQTDLGRFIREGEPIAAITSGPWRVRALLTEEQMTDASPKVGDAVSFRAAAAPSITIQGTIERIAPAGSRTVTLFSLTHLGGGDIVVDPLTGRAGRPYFDAIIRLAPGGSHVLSHEMTGRVRFRGEASTIGARLARRMIRFLNTLTQS